MLGPSRVQARRAVGPVDDPLGREAPATVLEALRSPGEPLDRATRAYFEPRFGQDFGRVRVHSGTLAEQSARDIDAEAYTVGQDMVFGAGRFAPQTSDGRRLLGHELAHVVQQISPAWSRPTPVPRLQRKPRGGAEGMREASVQVRWSEDEDMFYDRVVAALGRSPGFRGIDPADFNYASNTESTLQSLVRSFQNQYASLHHHHPREGEPVRLHLHAHYNPSEDLLTDKQISFVEEPGAGKGTQPPAAPAQEAPRSCAVAPKADESAEQRAQRLADETACSIATWLVTLDKGNAGAYATVTVSPDSPFPSKIETEGERDRQPDEGPLPYAKALAVVKAGIDLSHTVGSQEPIAAEFVYSFGDRVHGPGLHLEKSRPLTASSKPAPAATPQGGEEFEDECNENDVDYAECLKLQYDENVKEMLKAGEEEFKAWYDPYNLSGGGGGGNINIPLPGRKLKLPKGARTAAKLRKLDRLKKIVKSDSMAMKELAGGIHGIRGRLKGQAIAVVEVRAGTETVYAAATNSGAGWRSTQTSLLKELGIEQIPHTLSDTVHAEGNVRAWVENLRKTTGKDWKVRRWGMSATYGGNYICPACREIARQMGGIIEEF